MKEAPKSMVGRPSAQSDPETSAGGVVPFVGKGFGPGNLLKGTIDIGYEWNGRASLSVKSRLVIDAFDE
jgi:hypothetical protein